MNPLLSSQWVRWLVAATALVLLLIGAYKILQPFMSSIAWAAVLSFTTWPLYRRLRTRLGQRDALAASLMTCALLVAVVLPVLFGSWLLSQELSSAGQRVEALLQAPPEPPPWVRNLPVLGSRVDAFIQKLREDPKAVPKMIAEHSDSLQEVVVNTAGRIGRNLMKIVVTLLTAFFFYRYGEELVVQIRTVADRLSGERTQSWIQIVGDTVRAVLYGLLLTALAQGFLAAVGFFAAGVPAPILLGLATCFLALIPFGAPIVWLPASIWLMVGQKFVAGIALFAWCALVVSTIDNVLRPAFISGATRIPYLLVFFGVLGGIGAFGFIGVFIGPIILAVLLALWRKWASEVGGTAEAVVVQTRMGSENFVETTGTSAERAL